MAYGSTLRLLPLSDSVRAARFHVTTARLSPVESLDSRSQRWSALSGLDSCWPTLCALGIPFGPSRYPIWGAVFYVRRTPKHERRPSSCAQFPHPTVRDYETSFVDPLGLCGRLRGQSILQINFQSHVVQYMGSSYTGILNAEEGPSPDRQGEARKKEDCVRHQQHRMHFASRNQFSCRRNYSLVASSASAACGPGDQARTEATGDTTGRLGKVKHGRECKVPPDVKWDPLRRHRKGTDRHGILSRKSTNCWRVLLLLTTHLSV
jgi:hypothetical protein